MAAPEQSRYILFRAINLGTDIGMSTGKPARICRLRHQRRSALMRGWHEDRVLDIQTTGLAHIGTR